MFPPKSVVCFWYHGNMNYAAVIALLCCRFQKWSTPAEYGTTTTDMTIKHLDLQAQKAVASHQWKKKMDLTTDDDHGLLRLNNSCRVQSVTKTQRKKKVDSQKVDELYTANLRREKL